MKDGDMVLTVAAAAALLMLGATLGHLATTSDDQRAAIAHQCATYAGDPPKFTWGKP